MPPGSVLIIGFLGGFEHWNDEHRSAAVKLLYDALDTNGDGRLDAAECASARIVSYGQSWGGGAVSRRRARSRNGAVPVLLTVQVDSVGLRDSRIPANVRAAANFYQHDSSRFRA
jgi:hypothetical protein